MDLNLNMASQRSYQRSEIVTQRTVWRPQAETDNNQTQSASSGNPNDSIRLVYQQSLQQFSESSSVSQERTLESTSNTSTQEFDDLNQDPELMKTKKLLEMMFGVSFSLYKSVRSESDHPPPNNPERIANVENTEERMDINGQPLEQVSQRFHQIKETETTRFQANGEIVLKDGRRFDIEFSLDMARAREESFYGEMIISGKQVDPLTINLNGNMAQLSQNKVQFDINNDGEMDNVHYASGDSAFLAIDKNGNGRIDDGGELFGPQSGSGFTDLAQYDENQDGVIDKDDSIFEKLVLTQRDEAGNENVISLKEVGIEAFLLASQDTQFSLFNSNGERAGIIQETGLYLKSDGSVDSMQHVDLII
ncbi:hypothetical protein O1D97_13340 [Marinomonas sp. 15G1-11]|uniref:VCBS repeat-containing protein n=1 Tax=Marinomonas phaeophyticola TaxID=3004091 RepID=A0ABT4JWD6_9GAMM|nr:hypothetical protein [Marinomonas sp. 15G1-11]MCZ2722565.1 hypothetical protein [Marinomonas sp. 15G1-11]